VFVLVVSAGKLAENTFTENVIDLRGDRFSCFHICVLHQLETFPSYQGNCTEAEKLGSYLSPVLMAGTIISDICHAYHVVRSHGVPKENIITMMYDDIAYNKKNPYPGKIYNVPGGKDVYAGVKIDYSGIYVTSENFLAVLSGNKTAVKGGSSKVVESTHYDHIFVYFTDHGGVGVVCFPDSMLTVKDLNDVLKRMHKLKKFGRLVFYMEACESGSMFAKVLPKNIDVYAVTAANSHESSWGCYCDNKMKLPCLGDCFSINWIVNSEKLLERFLISSLFFCLQEDLSRETLASQFEIVKQKTNTSHVMHYGDLKIAQDYVAYYLGYKRAVIKNTDDDLMAVESKESTSWPSREIYFRTLERQLNEAETQAERRALQHKIQKLTMITFISFRNLKLEFQTYIESTNANQRESLFQKRSYLETFMKSLIWTIVPHQSYSHFMHSSSPTINSLHCFDTVIKAFHQMCFHFGQNPYTLKYTYVFANLCNAGIDSETIIGAMFNTCKNIKIRGIL
uniref:legumain n=1 Tax=Wuchereria bancrofti TaxID=6293 RepID=A0A1I8ET75_WUCBA